MVPIARRNLLADRGRLIISVSGVAFAVLLILVVLSLYRGWSGIGQIVEEVPADLWVVQQGTTDPFHSVSILEEAVGEEIAAVNGVSSVHRAYARTMAAEVDGKDVAVFLMAFHREASGAGAESVFFPERGTASVDSAFAKKHGVGVGDSITIAGRDLRVGQVYSGGNAVMFQFMFVSAEDARDMFGVPGTVSYFLAAAVDSAEADGVAARIEEAIPAVDVFTGEGFADAVRREVREGFLPVVGVLVVLGFVVGVAVIGLTTYTATVDKARDFGVMKAVGASGMFVYRVVIAQSLLVGLAGFAVGLGGAALVAGFAVEIVPEFVTDLQLLDVAGVFGAALVMAALASFIPVVRINQIDPAVVFRA